MDISGLISPAATDHQTLESLSSMMGISFLEERWTATLLSCLDGFEGASKRKLELSKQIMYGDFYYSAAYPACYALEDYSACAGVYLKSDLLGKRFSSVEEKSFKRLLTDFTNHQEAEALNVQMQAMAPISVFDWEEDHAQGNDFIHFYVIGVDKEKRGTGAFRRLVDPILDYADTHGLNCYLETFCDKLESLYNHFGFETIEHFTSPKFDIYERGMLRKPQAKDRLY